jgi:8-oxo-dGTP diphosphatase
MTDQFQPRQAVRALIVDEQQRVLLIHTWVPDTDTLIWLAPGGGLDPEEDPLAGLIREVKEETGLAITEAQGPVWRRRQKFYLHGQAYDQSEQFYVVPVTHFTPDNSQNPALDERKIFRGFHWWRAEDIVAATDQIFVPLTLGSQLQNLFTEGLPSRVIDVGR